MGFQLTKHAGVTVGLMLSGTTAKTVFLGSLEKDRG